MKIVVSDWETFFDSASGYTLKKMTTEAYLRDPRFEAHGCAVKWEPHMKAHWYSQHDITHGALVNLDWSDTMLVHHHAHFDSGIESFHYGIRPKAIGCTLSMARLLLGNHVSVSLDSVRSHFGLPSKLTPYHLFDGKHWGELSPADQKLVADGACDEVESIAHIFNCFMSGNY